MNLYIYKYGVMNLYIYKSFGTQPFCIRLSEYHASDSLSGYIL